MVSRIGGVKEASRIGKAAEAARAVGAEALLVTHPADVRWLTGFTGSNGAVAMVLRARTPRVVLFTDGRYTTQAREEVAGLSGLRVKIEKRAAGLAGAEWLAKQGVRRCGFDAAQTTVAALEGMRKALPAGVRRGFFVAANGLVARLREVKDAGEAERMRRAAALGCALFEHVLEHMNGGDVSEGEVAAQLEFAARMAGAEAMSFETIVAGGKRSALPHGRASGAKLPRRGFVTLDFGVLLDGYCSDMTRTVHLGKVGGKASKRERDVYDAVLTAQEAAVAHVRPGVTCEAVDEAARGVLRKAGLAKWFTHSTGHGMGLEIHEGPRLAAKQKQVLEAGMVVTIEPGVYLPGEFGVRIEDMVLVTESGGEVLTAASSKTLLEL